MHSLAFAVFEYAQGTDGGIGDRHGIGMDQVLQEIGARSKNSSFQGPYALVSERNDWISPQILVVGG